MAELSASSEVPTTGSIQLPPDPRSLEALGRHHTLEAALAELVDNSIDAGASHVLIRVVRDGDQLVRFLIADDGAGMSETEIDVAMTVGGAREYDDGAIGKFGLGLKAASFSQGRSVTVISRAAGGSAVGRQLQTDQAQKDFSCEIVEPTFATGLVDRDWGFPRSPTGTIIRWDGVKAFPHHGDGDANDRFLQSMSAKARGHLGLIFHRLLADGRIRVTLDTEDIREGVLLRSEVAALDPFGYSRTGAAGWPKPLRIRAGPSRIELNCHIWPGRSTLEQFKLDGNLLERQGLYVYLHDRVVQRGGWNGLIHPEKRLNLARIAVEVAGDVDGLVRLNPEKNGIDVSPEFSSSVWAARHRDGTTFEGYIERARGVFKDTNRRQRVRSPMLLAGRGFEPRVRRALRNEFPERDDDDIAVLWARFDGEEFFLVDCEQRTLWLNQRYRRTLLGGRRGGLNDIPLVKALMFLLTENIFAGQNLGPRDKDNLEAWQAVLTAAAKAERL
jgi:hypothetical protein